MRTIRRETGGYALLYVLIVVLVLCAGAMAICTVALRGYQGQVRSVEQTQQLYQAEGEIERFVALASDVSGLEAETSGGHSSENDAVAAAKEECWVAYHDQLVSYMDELDGVSADKQLNIEPMGSDRTVCQFTLTYQNESVKVTAEIQMALTYDSSNIQEINEDTDGDGAGDETTYTCTSTIDGATPTYLTYDISHDTEGEDTP